MEVDYLIAFTSGMLIGASPCILLMLSVFGTSLIITEEKVKFLRISIGLLSGMILTYVVMSIIFLFALDFFNQFFFFEYIFAGVLIFIGIWQIIECKKEKSTIFGTPTKVKLALKNFIEKNSGLYAFLVGIIFVLIKIPCFGGLYLALLGSFYENPSLFVYILLYIVGMLIPIILILILLRIGLESSKINDYRLKYRTFLRMLNGVILIFLALFLLIFYDIIEAGFS